MRPSYKFWPLVALALVALVFLIPAQAQDAPAPVITPEAPAEPEVTIEQLVQRALQNNPQLPIARQTQEAAQQRLNALRTRLNPSLQVVPRLVGNRNAADEEVILSQPLDLFGKRRAQAGVAAAELKRAQADTTLAERSLEVGVKNAGADLFAAQEAESLGQVQVEVAGLFRDAAARRAQLGDVPPVQVQRAELELLRVQNELTNAQAERLARRAALNQLIAQAPETPLRVVLPISSELTDLLRVRPGPLRSGAGQSAVPGSGANGEAGNVGAKAGIAGTTTGVTTTAGTTPGTSTLPILPPSPADNPTLGSSSQVGSDLVGLRGQVLPGALTNRPDIVGAQATLEARRAQVDVLRRQRKPDIELQARRNSTTTVQGAYALRAVITVPIFDFGSTKQERRAAEAEVRAQEATISLLRSQAAAQVEQALIRLQQQRQTVERYRTGIVPISIDLLRKTQIGYAAGASTYLEVLEAQRTLRQVQTEYLQALVGTRTGEAQLESALGAAPPANLTGSLINPTGPAAPPGTAAPGTVPPGVIPPFQQVPLNPPGSSVPATPTTPIIPTTPANRTGVR